MPLSSVCNFPASFFCCFSWKTTEYQWIPLCWILTILLTKVFQVLTLLNYNTVKLVHCLHLYFVFLKPEKLFIDMIVLGFASCPDDQVAQQFRDIFLFPGFRLIENFKSCFLSKDSNLHPGTTKVKFIGACRVNTLTQFCGLRSRCPKYFRVHFLISHLH